MGGATYVRKVILEVHILANTFQWNLYCRKGYKNNKKKATGSENLFGFYKRKPVTSESWFKERMKTKGIKWITTQASKLILGLFFFASVLV